MSAEGFEQVDKTPKKYSAGFTLNLQMPSLLKANSVGIHGNSSGNSHQKNSKSQNAQKKDDDFELL